MSADELLSHHVNGDWGDLNAYQTFLWQIMDKRNRLREARLAEELAVMKPLTAPLLPATQEVRPRVSAGGTIRVLNNVYSVPSGLKGKLVSARICEWQIEVWYANQCVERFPRLTGLGHHRVNYHHVIDSLLRKPGGFRDYRYRDDLFPRPVFRQAWESLSQRLTPQRADLVYLRILKLAADGSESDVASALEQVLAAPSTWDERQVAARLQRTLPAPPLLQPQCVNLADYDRLLGREVSDGAA